ncbi:MAG: tyrosine-type recombinase/integrase, partial [Butyrivibrio hungatei]|nr:tyrosine-type recombinase/integrase [Butyrivibrio hungatei]
LSSKWQMLIKYISCEGYSEREVQRFQEALDLISKHSAQRDLDGYNRLRHRYKSHKPQFLSWMLFDFYDMMPTNRKYYPSDYDLLDRPYRELIDEGMKAGKSNNLRDSTISIEAASVASFFLYLQRTGITSFYEIQEKHIRNYIQKNHCEQIIVYRIGLFIKRLSGQIKDIRLNRIADLFPKQRAQKKVYPAMSKEERGKLEAFLLDPQSQISLLERAVGITFLYTGMRKEDLLNLKLSDIDWAQNVIRYSQDKNGNINVLPLRPVVGNYLLEYIKNERPVGDCEFLFLSKKKVRGKHQRFNISELVNRLYDLTGIRQGRVRKGTHLLRHSLADELVNSGSDLAIVSKILGHKDPETTLGYLSANIEQLRECALDASQYPITHKLYLL